MFDEIDRALSSEEVLEPSSRFASRVMVAVRQEEAEVKERPLFPWLPFAFGVAACLVLAMAATMLLLPIGRSPAAVTLLSSNLTPQLAYSLVVLFVSLGAVTVSRWSADPIE